MTRTRDLGIALVLLCFTVLGVTRHLHNFGEDLASSYVGCRLLAAGEGTHLYSHSTRIFSQVGDPAWEDMAQRTGFSPLKRLHPYVQTPLWAYSLEPVCTRMQFRSFCDGYIVIFMLCTSGVIWLVARYWTPTLWHPGWIALIYAGLYLSEPFKYAIFLAQTHILYLFMTVLALILAERRWPVWAGILLALAAAVKITPGLLVIYWLITRKQKAALSFVLGILGLTALTVAVAGPTLTHTYFHSLAENANVLLLAFNNQSLAAWWMGLRAPQVDLVKWLIYPLPIRVKILGLLLTLVSSVVGGLLDRRAGQHGTAKPPYGALITMVGATMFASIAWSHYYIVLVIPVMFLLDAGKQHKQWLFIGCAVLILGLNLYPISFRAVHLYFKPYSLARSQFYAGVLCLLSLFTAWRARERLPLGLATEPGAG